MIVRNISKLSGLLLALIAALPCAAEPMIAPTLKEAAQSKFIVLARYQGYKPFRLPVTYFDGVMANYQLVKILKGSSISDPSLNVAFAFHDGSACEPEVHWKFSDAVMPKKDSQWILFLEQPLYKSSFSNAFNTYRGDFGRIATTDKSIAEIQALIAK